MWTCGIIISKYTEVLVKLHNSVTVTKYVELYSIVLSINDKLYIQSLGMLCKQSQKHRITSHSRRLSGLPLTTSKNNNYYKQKR